MLVASPLVADPGTTDDLSVADELKSLLDPTMLLGMSHPGQILQRAAFGRAVVGGEGSIARRLYDSVGEAKAVPDLAVTDSRLLVFTTETVSRSAGGSFFQRWFGPADTQARLVHEVPRSWVLGAVAAPRGFLRRGRMFVAFIDGSGCALVCVRPRAGQQAVAVIGPPRLEPRATGEEHA